MSLKIGIVGLPNVGKSTLFKALTREPVNTANFPFATIDPNVGIVKVPDERLYRLAEMSESKKTVPAAVEFVDIAGLVKGAHEGAGLGNQFLSHIREVDAIVEVVRAFEDPDILHVEGSVSPRRDIETIQIELAAADLQTVNKRLSKNEKDLKRGEKSAQEQKMILEKIKSVLEAGDLAVKANVSRNELKLTEDLHLLTLKPFLFVFNTKSETDHRYLAALDHKIKSLALNLAFEAELAEMTETEAEEFKNESRLDNLIKSAYELLDLITYFTTGEDETRGWTIKKGWTAPQAGSAIHTDFEKKFIRAEVISYDSLIAAGSWGKARQNGLLRIEGRDYVVEDGDVIEFKI